jgi:hypothetical protein
MADDDAQIRPQHAAFADNWVDNGGNGKQAAEDAGFASGDSAAVAASRLLRRADVQARIQERRAAAAVSDDEIVGTLVEHMRGDITDALPEDDPFVIQVRSSGVSRLIKKLRIKTRFIPRGDGKEPEREVTHELEFYDAQAAARTLGKYKGLEQAARENDVDFERRRSELLAMVGRLLTKAHEAGDMTVTRQSIVAGIIDRRPDTIKYLISEMTH